MRFTEIEQLALSLLDAELHQIQLSNGQVLRRNGDSDD